MCKNITHKLEPPQAFKDWLGDGKWLFKQSLEVQG